MFTISSVLGNRQSLDGGAMFGNVPRVLWTRWCEVDELGRIELATRAFLVEYESRRILVETGVGAFFPPHLRERYGVTDGEHQLLNSLAELGLAPDDIDVVLLSHLHFDHAGGLLTKYVDHAALELVFSRAQFLVGRGAFERAKAPHPRDRASFIPGLLELLGESGRLHLVDEGQRHHPLLGSRVQLWESHGHTPNMLIPTFVGAAFTATFCADLIPGEPWVHLPVTMGYDRNPELLIDEKLALYERYPMGAWLLFTHDARFAAGQLARDESGRFRIENQIEQLHKWDIDLGIEPSSSPKSGDNEPLGIKSAPT